MEFKDRLKQLREEKAVSSATLAAHFDKCTAAIRMWESGKSKPDTDTLIKLAEYFNCTTDYLLGVSDVRTYDESEKDKRIAELEKEIHLFEHRDVAILECTKGIIGLLGGNA